MTADLEAETPETETTRTTEASLAPPRDANTTQEGNATLRAPPPMVRWQTSANLTVSSLTTPVPSMHGHGETACMYVHIPQGPFELTMAFEWSPSSPLTDQMAGELDEQQGEGFHDVAAAQGSPGFVMTHADSVGAVLSLAMKAAETGPALGASYQEPITVTIQVLAPEGEMPSVEPVSCWWF
jgi:hypothetical protein